MEDLKRKKMNRNKQKLAIDQIGTYFVNTGKVCTQTEYTGLASQPVPGFLLKRLFKTYDNMITELKKTSYWAELNKPKAAPKPKAKPAPKVAKAKPAVKSAVKKGVKDE